MSPVAAPADRRFRRAHVKPLRRRTVRVVVLPAIKYALAAVAAAYGLYRGGVALAFMRARSRSIAFRCVETCGCRTVKWSRSSAAFEVRTWCGPIWKRGASACWRRPGSRTPRCDGRCRQLSK